jgi:hypothetical protein
MFTFMTTALILGSLLQDAAPAAPDSQAVPQDPKAVGLLEEFGNQLYSPEKAGLKTLSFDLDMPGPGGVSAGTLSVDWDASMGATGSFELADAMKAMIPEAMLGQVQEQMSMVSEQIALIQTNGVVSDILDNMTVKLEGVEDGYVKIVAKARGASTEPSRTLLFEDGLLAKTIQKVAGPMGEVEATGMMKWKALSDTDASLVLSSTTETSAGVVQSSNFVHEKVGDFYLVTKIDGEAMGQASTLTFKNFVVNGASMSAPTPEAR